MLNFWLCSILAMFALVLFAVFVGLMFIAIEFVLDSCILDTICSLRAKHRQRKDGKDGKA